MSRDPFRSAAVAVAVVAGTGMAVALAGPWPRPARWGAAVGMGLVVSWAPLVLWLKKAAVQRSLQAALAVVVLVFFGRLTVVLAGILVAKLLELSLTAYVLAFFAGYFALQVVEVAYVLAEWKRQRRTED